MPAVSAYSLRQTYAWATQEQLHWQIARLRTWLLGLLRTLRRDTWQSVEQLTNLVYHLRRDPFQLDAGLPGWRWHRANVHVEPSQMAFDVWRETYGKLIEAWLTGPASWLAVVEVGQAGDRPVAFRVQSQVPTGETAVLPPDALALPRAGDGSAEERLADRRTAPTPAPHRRRDGTRPRDHHLHPGPGRVPRSLAAGLNAETITAEFAAAGFALPAATATRLRDWQAKAGRHQLYDNLAVIECGEDMHPSEVSALVALSAGMLYPVAPALPGRAEPRSRARARGRSAAARLYPQGAAMTPPSLPVAIEAFNANDLTVILYQAGVKDLPKARMAKSDCGRN